MINKRKKKVIIGFTVTLGVLLVLFMAFYIYTLDYYRADEEAAAIFYAAESHDNITVFYPEEGISDTGLIFYPGGKVEASAYSPLLKAISDEGITCILVEMPFNLAVFGINSTDKIFEQFPEIYNWYLGGHSLGGAMASSYVDKNSIKLDGLILLGAYPINDSDLPTLAIYGTEDMGLDLSKLDGVVDKLEITGGNHAYFGNYGEQEGDGTASISREKQQDITVKAIIDFMK